MPRAADAEVAHRAARPASGRPRPAFLNHPGHEGGCVASKKWSARTRLRGWRFVDDRRWGHRVLRHSGSAAARKWAFATGLWRPQEREAN